MEVRPGYKQSEVGVIPGDWEVSQISRIANIYGGGTPSTTKKEYWQGIIPWVAAGDVSNAYGRYINKTSESITELGVSSCSTRIMPRGTIIIIARGATVGRLAQLGNAMAFNQTCYALVPKGGYDENYLYYSMKNSVASVAAQKSGTIFGTIIIPSFNNWLIPIPPTLAEQQAIAAALTDVDALIQSLEQLILKKRQIKQGAMQELFQSFEEWESFSLGAIADPKKRWSFTGGPFGSNLKSSDYTREGIRILQLQNIGDGEFLGDYRIFTSIQKADELLSCNIFPGDIIISKMGDPVGRACIIPEISDRYLMCSDGIRLAVDPIRFNTYFICSLINFPIFRSKVENASTGTTRKRIGLADLRNLELECPCIDIQSFFAEILSDIDAEIALLEAKLVRTHLLKQGMMHELLTGRIRLVE